MYHLAKFVANEMEEDYGVKTFSVEQPKIMVEYKAMSEKEKMSFEKDFPDWRQRPDVLEYHKERNRIETENNCNVSFLQECKEALADEPMERQKISNMLAQYPTANVRVDTVDWDR
jgi:hypothetical protein